jgi:hypothetical protein
MMEGVPGPQDELAEIDLSEDEIDAMMAAGEQVEVVAPRERLIGRCSSSVSMS